MNYKNLSKFVEGRIYNDINPILATDGSNASMFFCADVVGSRRFAQNYGGYPRSEIAEINDAANLEQQMNLLKDLQDYSISDNPNSGKSDAEIMLGHKSKYIQEPSETVSWLEGQIHERFVKSVSNETTASSSDTINFNHDDETQIDA